MYVLEKRMYVCLRENICMWEEKVCVWAGPNELCLVRPLIFLRSEKHNMARKYFWLKRMIEQLKPCFNTIIR